MRKSGRFLGGEAQSALTDLGDLVTRPHAGQGQRRVFARADDQVQAGRLVRQEKGHQIVHRQIADQMIVVEDQQQMTAGLGQVVDQGHHQFLGRRGEGSSRAACPRRSSAWAIAAIR